MNQSQLFSIVGIRPPETPPSPGPKRRSRDIPVLSMALLGLILLGCLCAGWISGKDPAYLDLAHCSTPPCPAFPFGTDALGRDLFSAVWHGGRISIGIGFLSTLISTAAAILYGSLSGVSPAWLDALLMRGAELLLSVPTLLITVFVQAILGRANVLSLSLVIGVTSWAGIAKVVRTEVRQLRELEYVAASRCMGGGFFHTLIRHLIPNFVPSILFMVVMNIRSAIIAESTLSFMGLGLPLDVISWGSMLSLAEGALTAGTWWVILVPGLFLITLLMCVTNLGNWLRRRLSRSGSNL